MKRLKALWDNKRPELAHLSERHLREQASRIIKKNLIPQGLTDQRTCEMDRTNEPVPEDLTRQTTSEFIRTHDPPVPPPSMQTIYELDSYFEDNVDCIFEMEQSENRDTEMLLNREDQLLYEELNEIWTFQFDKYKDLEIGKREYATRIIGNIKDQLWIIVNKVVDEHLQQISCSREIDLWDINVSLYV